MSAVPNPRQLLLHKIYLKDASVEVPQAPQVFTRNWQPQMDVQVNTAVSHVTGDSWQVLLGVTVTAKLGDDVAFLIEVHQGGVFALTGFADTEREAVLAGHCAGLIFPYAREAISELVQRAGFPAFLLQPINFDAIYAEHQARSKANAPAAEARPH